MSQTLNLAQRRFWTRAPKKPERLTLFGWAGLVTVFNLTAARPQKEEEPGAGYVQCCCRAHRVFTRSLQNQCSNTTHHLLAPRPWAPAGAPSRSRPRPAWTSRTRCPPARPPQWRRRAPSCTTTTWWRAPAWRCSPSCSPSPTCCARGRTPSWPCSASSTSARASRGSSSWRSSR